jgi:hypothetical protein
MYERIKELAEQCTTYINPVPGHSGEGWIFDKEKFAELIVQECAEICYHHSFHAGGAETDLGFAYRDCGNDIKHHFGVK